MARVLITGAEGFTGRFLVNRLIHDGHEVHGLVHRPAASANAQLASCHAVDLRQIDQLEQIVRLVQPERVVHLAAIAFVAHGDAAELYSTNILGTRNLLQVLASGGDIAPPAAVLLASSANVYGNRREGVLTEDIPPAPANDYGVTKAACELLAHSYADRLSIITVRPFNYTGAGQSENFLIPKIVAHAIARKPEIELGNTDVARDFSDVRTVVDCYARLLDAPKAVGEVFNVCSGSARSLAEVIGIVEAEAGHRMQVRVNPAFVRADEVRSLCGSRAKLESVIGPVNMPPFAETVAWMLNG